MASLIDRRIMNKLTNSRHDSRDWPRRSKNFRRIPARLRRQRRPRSPPTPDERHAPASRQLAAPDEPSTSTPRPLAPLALRGTRRTTRDRPLSPPAPSLAAMTPVQLAPTRSSPPVCGSFSFSASILAATSTRAPRERRGARRTRRLLTAARSQVARRASRKTVTASNRRLMYLAQSVTRKSQRLGLGRRAFRGATRISARYAALLLALLTNWFSPAPPPRSVAALNSNSSASFRRHAECTSSFSTRSVVASNSPSSRNAPPPRPRTQGFSRRSPQQSLFGPTD